MATALYGRRGNPVSVRGEVHRLRAQLDANVLRTQPYRLRSRVQTDLLDVRTTLAAGRIGDAVGS